MPTPKDTSPDMMKVSQWLSSGKLVHPLSGFTSVDAETALVGKPRTEVSKGLHKTIFSKPVEHTIFVILDGCGVNLLGSYLDENAFLRRNLVGTLNSVFPATTSAALTSYGTGEYPAQHGLLGWTTEVDHRLAINPLPWVDAVTGESLEDTEEMRAKVFHFNSMYDKLDPAKEVRIYQYYDDSPFTRAIRGIGPKVIKTSLIDLEMVVAEVPKYLREKSERHEETFIYIYCPEPDTTEHALGISSPAIGVKLSQLDKQLEELWRLLTKIPASFRMVVSADHGQLNLEHVDVYDAQDDDGSRRNVLPLGSLLKLPPTVEPRSFALHLAEGVTVEEARARITEGAPDVAEHWALLTPDEVEQLHILGPGKISDAAREQLGDLFGITDGPYHLSYFVDGKSSTEKMVGNHGGLLPAEVHIPFVVADTAQSAETMKAQFATLQQVYSADFSSYLP